MAKTITQLPDATVVNAADELIVQQGGVTKRATKTEVLNGIVNANVDAAAAIAGTKIAPNFGSQNVATTGAFRITGTKTTALINYLGTQTIVTPDVDDWRTSIRIGSASYTAPNVIEFWANNAQRALIDTSGNVGIGTSSPTKRLEVNAAGSDAALRIKETATYGVSYDITAGLGNNLTFTNDALSDLSYVFLKGSVGIGGTANAAAILDASSTTQGLLPPRMTTTQRDAITSPPAGLLLYNTSTNKLQVRTNTAWADLH